MFLKNDNEKSFKNILIIKTYYEHKVFTQNVNCNVLCSFTSLFKHGKSLEIEKSIVNVNYLK